MKKTKKQIREEIEKGLATFQKEGKKIKGCPIKAAANSKIMGIKGSEYLKQQKQQQQRRMRNAGK